LKAVRSLGGIADVNFYSRYMSAMNLWYLYIHISFPFKTTVDMSNLTPTRGVNSQDSKINIILT